MIEEKINNFLNAPNDSMNFGNVSELNLNVEVYNQNIFEFQNLLTGNVFVTRAFKPLKKILELIHNKAKNWKKFFVFLGKTGKNELLHASKKLAYRV